MGGPLRRGVAVVAALACVGAGATASFTATYTVRAGDSLSTVAARAGVSVADLVAANHLSNPNLIFAGQILNVSSSGASPAGPQPPLAGSGSYPSLLLRHPERLALLPSFRRWAAVSGVPTDLLEAMTWMESGWQANVVSPTGAIGIGQLEPATVHFVTSGLLGVSLDPRRPDDNIRMAAAYLGWLLRQSHGRVDTALASYYQGIGSVGRRGLLPETRHYVQVINLLRQAFAGA